MHAARGAVRPERVLRVGGRRRCRADAAPARLPAAAPARPVRGARHVDHRAAGLALLRGRDPQPVHRALRRARSGDAWAFPTRERIAAAREDELFAVGFTRRKAEYAVALARSDVDLDALALAARRRGTRNASPRSAASARGRPSGSSRGTSRGRTPGRPATSCCARQRSDLYGVDVHELGPQLASVPEPVGALPPDAARCLP